jgi:histidine triad (HIT) family protein
MSEDCPFCRVFSGEEPATEVAFIAPDGSAMALVPLNPVTDGHLLFIPRQHEERFEQLDLQALADVTGGIQEWALQHAEDYNIIQSNGPSATQTVQHVHFHYVPRRPDDGLLLPWSEAV